MLGSGRRDRPQRRLVRPAQSHQGHKVLEVHVAKDRLRIARPLGDGEPRVHVEVGRYQTVAHRGVNVEHVDVFGGQHDFAHRAARQSGGAENNALLLLADQSRRPGVGGVGAKLQHFRGLRGMGPVEPFLPPPFAPTHHPRHRRLEHPHGRPDAECKPPHHGRKPQAHPFLVAHCKHFGNQLTQHDRHDGQGHNDHDDSQDAGQGR